MEHTTVVIRKIGFSQLNELVAISRQTFIETFTAQNTEANMQLYLQTQFHEDVLRKELDNPHSEFHFAYVDEKPAGYLKINFAGVQTELQQPDGMEIERIYATKDFLGSGVGRVLLDKALERAAQAGMRYVWLGVWEENRRAIRFYEKNGFVLFDKHIFQLGDDAQTDWMMRKNL
jgi:diamine N-acetyltransferase